ncbi:hypothetical protein F5Y05DRAFT_158672 [Hypoxylon sp. FL0543]|nr:hypothetical protein F5Y05DRAFT_158672 [Hypoxylon sp. FL0543]
MDQHQREYLDDESNIREGGRREHKNDSVPAKIGLSDPTACINACFHQFVDEWLAKTHGTFEDVCKQLSSHAGPNTELWKLYCCDSINCGVRTDRTGQTSVDSIINRCQNTGSYFIYDPGPPSPDTFNCSLVASDPGESGFRTASPVIATTTSISSSSSAETSLSSEANTSASGMGAVPSAQAGLTEGGKAAIGICSSLAIIAIIFLLGFLISQRRSRPKNYMDNALNASFHARSSSEPPSGSQTPLITRRPSASSKGLPLTPPARLSDRRFLPSLLKHGDTPNSSLASGVKERSLAIALDSSNEKKSAMRDEHQAAPNGITRSPASPSSPAAVHFAPHFLRGSGISHSSELGRASTLATGSSEASSVPRPTATALGSDAPLLSLPISPTRPRRPHEGSLEIPNLVTPAGPPPNRALPAPPPDYPASPTFPVSPITPSSSPAPLSARPLALSDGAHAFLPSQLGPTDHRGHMQSSTRDLLDTAEREERETSESWGSWAGGLGVGASKRSYTSYGQSRDNIKCDRKAGESGCSRG